MEGWKLGRGGNGGDFKEIDREGGRESILLARACSRQAGTE